MRPEITDHTHTLQPFTRSINGGGKGQRQGAIPGPIDRVDTFARFSA
jgi:hypothetical protein